MDDEDLEEAGAYVVYRIDCPYCGDPMELGDLEPDVGEKIECENCNETFLAASS